MCILHEAWRYKNKSYEILPCKSLEISNFERAILTRGSGDIAMVLYLSFQPSDSLGRSSGPLSASVSPTVIKDANKAASKCFQIFKLMINIYSHLCQARGNRDKNGSSLGHIHSKIQAPLSVTTSWQEILGAANLCINGRKTFEEIFIFLFSYVPAIPTLSS